MRKFARGWIQKYTGIAEVKEATAGQVKYLLTPVLPYALSCASHYANALLSATGVFRMVFEYARKDLLV
jgi:hypothetical protein